MNLIKRLPDESKEDYIIRATNLSIALKRKKRAAYLMKKRNLLNQFLETIIELTLESTLKYNLQINS